MARYLMQQKLVCLGDDYKVKDEGGREVFYIDGKVWSIRDNLSFQDMKGNELASISQKLLAWGPTYTITRGGAVAAVVKKSLFTFFRCQFTVDVPGPDDIVAEGDFLDHEYAFTRHDKQIAAVSKRWFSWTDTYGVEVNGEDDVLILAAAVVIDLCCHERRK
jgi:uncharacterized protein YxjI